MVLGSIEAGGTKFVCAIGNHDMEVLERISIPTTTPEETLPKVFEFFKKYEQELEAVGVGAFGPIDSNKKSATFGYITSTPKLAWQNYDFIGELKRHLNVQINWNTDVNAAAYGEYYFGHGKDLESLVYYTFGTGVGGGAIQRGEFVGGMNFPEMGHMIVKRHPEDNAKCVCPFHSDCLEGLAAGPALQEKAGRPAFELEPTDPIWDIEAYYAAQCIYNTTLILAPEVIVLGGGVMQQTHLLKKVKQEFEKLMNGYVGYPSVDDYIQIPALGNNAATIGCLAMAKALLK